MKGHILYDSIFYVKYPDKAIPETESRLMATWRGRGVGSDY